MLSHLVRRAAQAGAEHLSKADFLEKQANAFAELNYEMPTWGIAMLALTALFYMALMASVEYTVRLLIINLAILESPTSATVSIYKPVSTSGSEQEPDYPLEKRDPYADIEVEKATITSKPVTASIRSTVMHLHSLGGFRARWRGIGIYAMYTAVVGLVHFLVMCLPLPLSPVLASFAGSLAASRLHCAWTHASVSMPSTRTLKQRMAPLKGCAAFKQLAAPTLLKTLAVELSAALTVGAAVLSFNRLSDLVDAKSTSCAAYMPWLAAPFVVAVASFVVLVTPAYVVLIRKEASLLPADEDTVVPVDRTFGGRTDEATGFLSVRDAWKGFTNEAFARVIKTYVKFFCISLGLLALCVQALLFEAWFVMGDNLTVLVSSGIARAETLELH